MIEPKTTYDKYGKLVDRVGICHCGAVVDLFDPLTNECECCGRLYNGSGQELRPTDQWKEDFDVPNE